MTAPLFSLYSKKSVGIGEAPDLKLLVDWCKKTGLSIIQLLPLNDVGFDFRPYDAQSSPGAPLFSLARPITRSPGPKGPRGSRNQRSPI